MTVKPPGKRTLLWQPITEAAANERFVLQVCESCQSVQYPPREVCGHCLSQNLKWQDVDSEGVVVSHTRIHASLDPFFATPTKVCSVKLDCGPVVLAHAGEVDIKTGIRVCVKNAMDESGQSSFSVELV